MPETVFQQDIDRLIELLETPDTAGEFRGELVDLFKSGAADTRREGAATIEQLAYEVPDVAANHLDLLCELLTVESDPEVRLPLARGVATAAQEASREVLTDVRAELQRQVAGSGRSSVTGYLLAALTAVVRATEAAYPPIVETAGDLLDSDQGIVRYHALAYLAAAAQFTVEAVVPYTDTLATIATEGPPDDRAEAVAALRYVTAAFPERLADDKLQTIVREGLESGVPAVTREAAAMAANLLVAGQLPGAVTAELDALLDAEETEVRRAAARAIIIVGQSAPELFGDPEATADRLESVSDDGLDLATQYGEQYQQALTALRDTTGGETA